ncbi:FGFR1 oncogene partner 2 homolog [Cephus cinctus]|uniref:FGFR1 oncogene partner 2 homolog n=1 Tax=Cephus cinctus TaxID=211228 RepID=A0AAJ7FKZ2_CEPCN|nr:FGFR1 oncogene partner 2 homolog [Cephus cinctus]XP_015596989.1 FGFR1 oncogene partner 2 homolog [Cephus cinctus]
MSLTFQQIILDAKKLVSRITDQENAADYLITEIQAVCSEIDNMNQYKEEVEILNTEAKQRPHLQVVARIQQENRYLRDIQAENKELRNALEEHQNTLELIMSKYRQQTATLIRTGKTDFSSLYNSKYANIISSQAEKINEMAAVMKTAAALDDENELKDKETYFRLKEENAALREIVGIANKFGSLQKDPPTETKMVQTDSLE